MRWLYLIGVLLLLTACITPTYPAQSPLGIAVAATQTATVLATALPTAINTATYTPTPTDTLVPTLTDTPTSTNTPTNTPSPTPTATATNTQTPTATPTFTPSPIPSPTSIPLCTERIPNDHLLTFVTRDYRLSREYEPADLVPLSDHFDVTVLLGFDTFVREPVVQPLVEMLAEMTAAELKPTIISGYRSYDQQLAAWRKWMAAHPDRASLLSAPPGASEHQLGTTVDFGSPELDNEFHTYFYQTAEGAWLLENAHRFGFTLSYPREATEITQFYYEPWHYRYVGVELATQLRTHDVTLTEWQLAFFPEPCETGD